MNTAADVRLLKIRDVHRLLVGAHFYPLCLCTAIAYAFLAGRMRITRTQHYRFLSWNLFLAWIPYWCSVGVLFFADHLPPTRRRVAAMCFLAAGWLAFFPNAPYIVTDFHHFLYTPQLTWWYDLGLILAFALTGCFLAVVSLRVMQSLVERHTGSAGGWLFAIATIGLSGLGIYFGRFLRLNSWDLLLRPARVLNPLADGLTNPLAHARPIGVTLMFSSLLLAIYVMFASVQRSQPTGQ